MVYDFDRLRIGSKLTFSSEPPTSGKGIMGEDCIILLFLNASKENGFPI